VDDLFGSHTGQKRSHDTLQWDARSGDAHDAILALRERRQFGLKGEVHGTINNRD
jgi:hypothetical protein